MGKNDRNNAAALLAEPPSQPQLCELSNDGRLYVSHGGEKLLATRVYAVVAPQDGAEAATTVTLVVEAAGDEPAAASATEPDAAAPGEGRRVVHDAQDELTLRCGRSSITLTRSGKVIIKGTSIVSRASGTNKIRGAQINLN